MNPSNLPVVIYLFPILSTFAFTSFVIALEEASETSSLISLRVSKRLSAYFHLVEMNGRIYYRPQGQRRAICITNGWKLQVAFMITAVEVRQPEFMELTMSLKSLGYFSPSTQRENWRLTGRSIILSK